MSGDRYPMLHLEWGRSGVEEGGAAVMGLRSGTLLAFCRNATPVGIPPSYPLLPPLLVPPPGPLSFV